MTETNAATAARLSDLTDDQLENEAAVYLAAAQWANYEASTLREQLIAAEQLATQRTQTYQTANRILDARRHETEPTDEPGEPT